MTRIEWWMVPGHVSLEDDSFALDLHPDEQKSFAWCCYYYHYYYYYSIWNFPIRKGRKRSPCHYTLRTGNEPREEKLVCQSRAVSVRSYTHTRRRLNSIPVETSPQPALVFLGSPILERLVRETCLSISLFLVFSFSFYFHCCCCCCTTGEENSSRRVIRRNDI